MHRIVFVFSLRRCLFLSESPTSPLVRTALLMLASSPTFFILPTRDKYFSFAVSPLGLSLSGHSSADHPLIKYTSWFPSK
ncbi:MAG: hypothetical protein ABI594_16655 [Ginsengibacter sp.]